MAEAWKPVPACRWFGIKAGVFEGSSSGHARLASGRALTEVPDRDGYLRVKHAGRWFAVHVLVALAWHGAPQVRHLHGNRQDNRPAELAWGSRREDERDKKRQKNRKEGGVSLPFTAVTPVTGGLLR